MKGTRLTGVLIYTLLVYTKLCGVLTSINVVFTLVKTKVWLPNLVYLNA